MVECFSIRPPFGVDVIVVAGGLDGLLLVSDRPCAAGSPFDCAVLDDIQWLLPERSLDAIFSVGGMTNMRRSNRVSTLLMSGALTIGFSALVPMAYAQGGAGGGAGGAAAGSIGGAADAMGSGGGANTGGATTSPGNPGMPSANTSGSVGRGFTGSPSTMPPSGGVPGSPTGGSSMGGAGSNPMSPSGPANPSGPGAGAPDNSGSNSQ